MQTGIADPNPYDGVDAGKLDLWTYDHYHASTAGYYLEALVVFGSLTGRDPRSLGDAECSGFELGLDRSQVKALQQVAFDELGLGTRQARGARHRSSDPVQAGSAGALCRCPLNSPLPPSDGRRVDLQTELSAPASRSRGPSHIPDMHHGVAPPWTPGL